MSKPVAAAEMAVGGTDGGEDGAGGGELEEAPEDSGWSG